MLRTFKSTTFKRMVITFVILITLLLGFKATQLNVHGNSNAEEIYQRLIVEEAKKLQGKVKYVLSGKWYDSGSGYSINSIQTECNGYVRRVMVNALYKAKEQGIDLDPSYDGLLKVTGDGLDLRGRLMDIEKATGKKTITVPRNITNSDYTPNIPEMNKFLDTLGAGSVVFFQKPNKELHWGIYAGKENGKHMVFHNTRAYGNSGYNDATYEEFTGMWFGKGNGYIFKSVYNPFDSIPAQGTIEIEKNNSIGEPIQDVTFTIYENDKKTVVGNATNLKTNNKGKIIVPGLYPDFYYAKETSTPNPYILDDKTWWEFNVIAGETTKAINATDGKIINQEAKGIITIDKKTEEGVPYADVTFVVKNNSGAIVDTIKTGINGKAETKQLPLGTYSITETNAPIELEIDPTPKSVTLTYKDSKTPVVYGSVSFVNKIKPVAIFGIDKIRVDTQKSNVGLVVNAWFTKTQNYDYEKNGYGDVIIKLELFDRTNNRLIETKNIPIKDLKTQYDFNVNSTNLKPNSKAVYEVVVTSPDENKVSINQGKLSADGYTSTEQSLKENANTKQNISSKNVVRTERSFGRDLVIYNEYFEISVNQIQPLRTGRGFEYDVSAFYSNDLNKTHDFSFIFKPDKKLVDPSYSRYLDIENPIIKLVKSGDQFKLPHVRTEIRTGEILSQEDWLKLSAVNKERYLDGKNRLYTPIWETDLGKYNTVLNSNNIGINSINIEITDEANLFAFMFGWYDENGASPSADLDGIVLSPVMAHDPFPTGIPDNWGYTKPDGTRELTATEQAFFGNESDLSLTYNLNGGTGVNANEMKKYDSNATITNQIPTKVGSRFITWIHNGKEIDAGTSIHLMQDTVISAQWDKNEFSATFNTNGGSSIPRQIVHYGESVARPTNPIKQGYVFFGWDQNLDTQITDDIVFNALWEEKVVDVVFDTKGGTSIPTQTITQGGRVLVPTNPSKYGFDFKGWSPNIDNLILKDTVFTAQWEVSKHIVYFDTDGAKEIPPQNITHESMVVKPTDPVKNGYTFTGWSPKINLPIKNDTTFTALYLGNEYNVSFDSNGGSKVKSQIVRHGDLSREVEEPTKTGFSFTGWSPNFDTVITRDTVFTANWAVADILVEFDTGTEEIVPYQMVAYATKAKLPKTPTRVGYTFKGWSPDITQSITEDIIFTANWELNKYTVSFNSNGGTAVASQSVNHGSKATVPTAPTRVGHTFNGWSPDIATTTITGARTFTAQWTPIKYTVTFNSNGGTAVASQSVSYGSKATVPTNPTRVGHTFNGWSPNIATTTITGVRTFTAQWTPIKYTVTFNSNGGTAVASQSISYGSKATVPTNPTRVGHTFNGWSPNIATTTITGARTFTAQWTANTYTVSYNANGGTGASGLQYFTFNSGASISKTVPTRSGYTFSHWTYNGQKLAPGQAIPLGWGSFDLTAQWNSLPLTHKYGHVQGTLSNGNLFQVYYTETYRGNIFEDITAEVVIQKIKSAGSISGTGTWSVTIGGNTFTGSKNYSQGNGSTGFSNLGWINLKASDIKGSANYSVKGSVNTTTLGNVTTNTGYKPK